MHWSVKGQNRVKTCFKRFRVGCSTSISSKNLCVNFLVLSTNVEPRDGIYIFTCSTGRVYTGRVTECGCRLGNVTAHRNHSLEALVRFVFEGLLVVQR